MPGNGSQMPLRVLILGCGSIGQRHIRNLQALGVRDIRAFDVDEERRRVVRDTTGVQVVGTLAEAWDWGPNIALVLVPTHLHTSLALQAAEHGCHLFIEKPLSHSLDDVASLCAEVRQRHLVTMVACNMRFHPGPATVKRLLTDNTVGKIVAARIQSGSFLPRWRPQQDYRQSYSASPEWGGVILDCIHEIDLALWYLGPATLLHAAHVPAASIGLETDGIAEIILRHESGALSNVHLNFVQRDYRRSCQIIGSEGTIYWDFAEHQVWVYGPSGEIRQRCPEPEGWELNQMYLDELESFLESVRNGAPTVNPVPDSVACLNLALSAKRTGGRYAIGEDDSRNAPNSPDVSRKGN